MTEILFTVFPTEIFNLSFLLIKTYSILLQLNLSVAVQLSSNGSCDVFMYGLRRLSRVEVRRGPTLHFKRLTIYLCLSRHHVITQIRSKIWFGGARRCRMCKFLSNTDCKSALRSYRPSRITISAPFG